MQNILLQLSARVLISSVMKSFLIAFVILISLQATAAIGWMPRPDVFYQPSFQRMMISLDAQYGPNSTVTTVLNETKTSESQSVTYGTNLKFGYGLNDEWAIQARLGYETTQTDLTTISSGSESTSKSYGFNDFGLELNNTTDFQEWGLFFGLISTLNLSKKEIASSTSDGNSSTGGPTFTPYIGFLTHGVHRIGARAEYLYKNPRVSVHPTDPETESSIRGGNITTGFIIYQFDFEPFAFDFRYSYSLQERFITSDSAGIETTGGSISYPGYQAGLQYQASPETNLRISYQVYQFAEQNYSSVIRTEPYQSELVQLRVRFEYW